MNDDNFLDTRKVWYEHYHDVMDGKPNNTDVKVVTELAGSIIYHMHDERARICKKLGLDAGASIADILGSIDGLSAKRK